MGWGRLEAGNGGQDFVGFGFFGSLFVLGLYILVVGTSLGC